MIGSSKRSIGRLLALSAALAGIVGLELATGPFFVPEPPQKSAAVDTSTQPANELPVETQDISTFAEIVARPLFAPSRRPPPVASADSHVEASVAKSVTFDLIGVMLSNDRRIALLRPRDATKDKVLQASEGQTVEGWEVRSIKPTQVVLARGDDSEVIKINDVAEHPGVNDTSLASRTPAPASGEPPAVEAP
jgi:hypothetical protein